MCRVENVNDFKLTDSDFENFKTFLKANSFSFETNTEKALKKTIEEAKAEGLDLAIKTDYNTLVSSLNKAKIDALDANKNYIIKLLTEDIVKRYVYREGLYNYLKLHDPEIKKASEILASPTEYLEYLR